MKKAFVALFLVAAGCGGQANATPASSPAAVAAYGQPPAGVPLIYVGDPKHAGWYIGFDWAGKPRGTIKLAQPLDQQGQLTQAPDGAAFAVAPAAKGGYQQFLDRLGNPVPNEDSTPRYQDEMWADDSMHLCTLDGNGREWQIGLKAPGVASMRHSIASNLSVANGIIAIAFRSCSVKNDRAVLVYNYQGRPTDVYVVRISDGTILYRQSHPANTLGDITASPDGSLLAESSIRSTGFLMGTPAPSTVIRRVSDGSVQLSLDPAYGVVAFNRDDTVALVNTSPWAADVPTKLALVNLQTAAILWRSDGQDEYGGSLEQPAGGGFAVLLKVPSDTTTHPAISLLILNADGTPTAVPGRYARP